MVELKCMTVDTLHWYKKDKLLSDPLPLRYMFRKKGQMLLIYNATKTDSGTYTCVASNNYGTTNKTIQLFVEGRNLVPFCT